MMMMLMKHTSWLQRTFSVGPVAPGPKPTISKRPYQERRHGHAGVPSCCLRHLRAARRREPAMHPSRGLPRRSACSSSTTSGADATGRCAAARCGSGDAASCRRDGSARGGRVGRQACRRRRIRRFRRRSLSAIWQREQDNKRTCAVLANAAASEQRQNCLPSHMPAHGG
jgi:hypothetical protein